MKIAKLGALYSLIAATLWAAQACGVKADPVPPATPAEIGHGKPLYRPEEEPTPPMTRIQPVIDQGDGQRDGQKEEPKEEQDDDGQ